MNELRCRRQQVCVYIRDAAQGAGLSGDFGRGVDDGCADVAELVREKSIDEPVAEEQDVCLGSDGLREPKEEAGGLG